MSRLGTALVAAVALLSVGACTGEEPADGDPSAAPRVSATPSATSTPTPPPLPPEAQEHSADGAAAFVEYWNEVLNYSMRSLDSRAIEAASDEACGACRSINKLVTTLRRDGGFSGDPQYRTTVTSSQLIQGEFVVTANLTTSDFMLREKSDSEEALVRGDDYAYIYRLSWDGAGWRVRELREQEVPR